MISIIVAQERAQTMLAAARILKKKSGAKSEEQRR
jgi:hypothetical protein